MFETFNEYPFAMFITYKILCLVAGSFFCYLGYRLFRANILSSAGDLEASNNKGKFSLINAAPGTFFCVFGAFIVIATVFRGFDFSKGGGVTKGNLPSKNDVEMSLSNTGVFEKQRIQMDDSSSVRLVDSLPTEKLGH